MTNVVQQSRADAVAKAVTCSQEQVTMTEDQAELRRTFKGVVAKLLVQLQPSI